MGRNQRDVAEGIFAGRFEDLPFDHFKHTVPESRVGLDTFKYVAGLVRRALGSC